VNKNSHTEENYLKAIFKLQEKDRAEVSTNDIAKLVNTRAASVTDMLKRLADKNLVHYKKYQGVSLTDLGKKAAINIIRKHRLWESFLVEKLNFKWDEVHDIAEQMEHIESEELINRLNEFLGFPEYDPHGDPIPSKNGVFAGKKMNVLHDMPVGFMGNISGVNEHSPAFLNHLDKINIKLGVQVKVEDRNDYDNSFWISIDSAEPVFISKEVAKNLLVFKK
jgi:DtxR family Mn-dependent transcriptional regulator